MSLHGLNRFALPFTLVLASALLFPALGLVGETQAASRKSAPCGVSRELYLGTYKGRVFKEWQTPLTDEQLKDPLTRMANDALLKNNYTLTVRFQRDARGTYQAETLVQFDSLTPDTVGPSHKDTSSYLLNLDREPAKVEFVVTRRPAKTYATRPQEPPRTGGIEKTTSRPKPTSHTLVFKETLALDALDCDSGGVPQRLLFTRTIGGQQPIVETRELFRTK
ncbi:hypothetical protein HUA74_43620 [Myxococcus sp. CA051A]|uniref:hypothetical protein n=1 Tax=Myxococcus sp. CA051A TaxID=2741739 RepID=UPI00157B95AF|nr:hypothetical protein [Myxococcus sp. CA051A]NTX67558.1 hypothetical protein [Myxococcus sp. CA051A]